MVLFTTTWNCIGNEDFSHPQITNNTHKCSFPGCHQKCPPFVNFLLWLKGNNSEELYQRKIIVWPLIGVSLSLFCYSLSQKALKLEAKNQQLNSQLKVTESNNTVLSNQLKRISSDYDRIAQEFSDLEQDLTAMTNERDTLLEKDYRNLTFLYIPESRNVQPVYSGSNVPLSGKLSSSQKEHFYYLDVKNQSKFNLVLSNLSNDADIYLVELCRDGSQRNVSKSTNGGTANDVLNLNLKSGIYMIKIKLNNDSSTSYNLNVTRKI